MHISWTYLELFNSGLQCELLLEAVVEKMDQSIAWKATDQPQDVSLQAESVVRQAHVGHYALVRVGRADGGREDQGEDRHAGHAGTLHANLKETEIDNTIFICLPMQTVALTFCRERPSLEHLISRFLYFYVETVPA